ncbi:HD domain-containing protein [Streptomyces sp. NPDC059009]|uniref:HD domain-containing protein n=1 Tax=Streptomyces sp. NPDC059009 TaxID=3346694 RepID=UPI003678260B
MPAHPSRRDAPITGAAALSAPAITTDAAADDDIDAAQGLSFPGTTLARKARGFVDEEAQPYLRNHSLRAFLFGRAAAAQAGRRPGEDYDEEVLFLICALHDMGLTARAADDRQRFEVAGADLAARFLEDNGVTDTRVDTVWDGIALHTSPGFASSPVHRHRRPPEIGIGQHGILLDIEGGPDDLPPGYASRVHAVHPRLGGARALSETLEARSLSDPATAPPMTLPGEILHQLHPELPYTTWQMTLDASRWGD